ncbi:MAG: phosphotransferase [Bacteroidia bacterium]|nr:phosphotransferase [Bacteroidia bacterium]
MGLIDGNDNFSKAQVKEYLLSKSGGDLIWQKLQGQVYGKYMHLSAIFPGFVEFLYLSKLRDHRVFVVSHKSEFGHFDEERVPLKEAAMYWMSTNKLVGSGLFTLSKSEVFFEPTRESKINRICVLGCTHFIDDLKEVLEEPEFPVESVKILFDPQSSTVSNQYIMNISSWRGITQHIHGEWTDDEVCSVVQVVFPTIDIQKAELRKGRCNSRIYQLFGRNEISYALKVYPDRQLDSRPRLETEFSACNFLESNGFPVMKALVNDEHLNWAVYSWVSGTPIHSIDMDFVDESANFIKRLLAESQSKISFKDFSEASEACLSGAEIVRQIHNRIRHLEQVKNIELLQFLNEFLPNLELSIQATRKYANGFFDTQLTRSKQILSPSDFGAHNTIRNESGQIIFIDFEYFGWDDPVKLVSDFYWHPGMDLSDDLKNYWIQYSKSIFCEDKTFDQRLRVYLPLFGLRWCLILLNEFLPNRLNERIRADNMKSIDLNEILLNQLNKSNSLLKQVMKILEYGSTLKIS